MRTVKLKRKLQQAGYRKPSPKTVRRIQEGIRKYAEELSRIVLI